MTFEDLFLILGIYLGAGAIASITVGIWAHRNKNPDSLVLLEASFSTHLLAWPIMIPIVIIHTLLRKRRKENSHQSE